MAGALAGQIRQTVPVGRVGHRGDFYRLPREYHKDLNSNNLLELLNQKFKRRTHIVRIFTTRPVAYG